MRLTSKGQVTIPQAIRDALGLHPETEVEFAIVGDSVRIRKARAPERSRGRRVVDRLRGTGTVKLSTDEILAFTRGE
jgi:AbrB family looped-hinge helix DNA binding protein